MTNTNTQDMACVDSAPEYNVEPKYTYDEVLQATSDYLGGDQFAAKAWVDKYALRINEDDERPFCELTPADMHDRLAYHLHRIELKYPNPRSYQEIRESLDGFKKIVPQGSPMYGIGNPFVMISLSNCVVVESPEDDLTSIIGDRGAELGNLFKRRAGVGIAIDTLRPEEMSVNNAARQSTGAHSFADYFSNVCRKVGQNGRRGALMITMHVRHPDIHRFTTMKQNLQNVTGANISIMLGDDFMKAATEGREWIARWSSWNNVKMTDIEVEEFIAKGGEWVECVESFSTTGRVDPKIAAMDEQFPAFKSWVWKPKDRAQGRKVFLRKFNASDLWELINRCARNTAEPGLLFWDNYCRNLPAHFYPGFESVSTNPCSEIALSPYDSCRLTSINLTGFVKNAFGRNAYFDLDEFAATVSLAQRLMDDIVDLEIECLENMIEKIDSGREKELWQKLLRAAVNGRRTGLGTHGLADCLAQLCLRYDSDDALKQVDTIYRALRDNAYQESITLADERGAFPVFDYDLESECDFIKRLPAEMIQKMRVSGRRNISILTNAPTGTVSAVSRTSSGIEPTFQTVYMRRKKINPSDKHAQVDFKDANGDSWQHFFMFERNVQHYMDRHPEVKLLVDGVLEQNPYADWGKNLEFWKSQINEIIPSFFVGSDEIDPLQRVRLQGVLQAYIDHGVSSTINLHKAVTTEDIMPIYEAAWKYGLKGVTVYRDKSRDGVLVTSVDSEVPTSIVETTAPKRPLEMHCDIHRTIVDGQKWTIFVGLLDNKPYEVFGGLSESVEIPKRITAGTIIKRKCDKEQANGRKSCYDLVTGEDDDQLTVRDIATAFNDGVYAWATRQLSLSLRHGVPPKFIVEQLKRSPASHLHDFSRAMARVLGKYAGDDEEDGGDGKQGLCKSGNCE